MYRLLMCRYATAVAFISIGLFAWACSGEKPANVPVNLIAAANKDSQNPSKDISDPSPSSYDELAAGKKLYATNCSACHRANGTGGKIEIEGKMLNPENLTKDKYKKLADQKFIEYIRDGMPDEGMPAFKDKLSSEEMQAILKFIRMDLQK